MLACQGGSTSVHKTCLNFCIFLNKCIVSKFAYTWKTLTTYSQNYLHQAAYKNQFQWPMTYNNPCLLFNTPLRTKFTKNSSSKFLQTFPHHSPSGLFKTPNQSDSRHTSKNTADHLPRTVSKKTKNQKKATQQRTQKRSPGYHLTTCTGAIRACTPSHSTR